MSIKWCHWRVSLYKFAIVHTLAPTMQCIFSNTSVFCPQVLYSHIVADIKRINAKHKNNKVNTVLDIVYNRHNRAM